MASLVADYGESSDDSEENADNHVHSRNFRSVPDDAESPSGTNFFGAPADENSDDSDSSVEKQIDKLPEHETTEKAAKLPSPFGSNVSSSSLPSPHLAPGDKAAVFDTSPTSSVFVNPFQQAEQAKLGILEKHVRLTEAAPHKPASKQVCFKFKKGTCHLGDKCRYFHDRSNITVPPSSDHFQASESTVGTGFGQGDSRFAFNRLHEEAPALYHPAAQYCRGQPSGPELIDDDNYMLAAKAKKRFGVTDNMQPPKRALMVLDESRQKERPWTVKKK